MEDWQTVEITTQWQDVNPLCSLQDISALLSVSVFPEFEEINGGDANYPND